MRDHRTNRAARELPAGYQFGDASQAIPWRQPSDNAAEQLRRRATCVVHCAVCKLEFIDSATLLRHWLRYGQAR